MSRLVHPHTEASSSRDGGSIISPATGGGASKKPRDTRGATKIQRPRNVQKIEIAPNSDVEYVGPDRPPRYHLSCSWGHYYGERDENGLTAADRLKKNSGRSSLLMRS